VDERRILLAVTGGIAAYKTPELVRALKRAGHDVRCAMTRAAAEFVSPLALQTVSGHAVRSALFEAGWDIVISDAPPGTYGWEI